MRYVAVVDGEHYPPVVEAALSDLTEAGHEVAAAVLVGGREKLAAGGLASLGSLPVRSGDEPRGLLERAITEMNPEAVLDLSDEPVLDYRLRHQLAAVALFHGVRYEGADFTFEPPPRPHLARSPSIAIAGTGKRTGKTAVAGYAARLLKERDRKPVVVAMGRGGPPEPEVLHGDQIELTPQDLVELAAAGRHAASDYIEDALLARVPTVGCRRCGGGLAGAVVTSNVARGIEVAGSLGGDILLLEGSGAALPPAHADVTGLVVPASIDPEYLSGYMGPYRMLLADFVVVTMCESPFGSPSQISGITARVSQSFRATTPEGDRREAIRVVHTVFRPTPTRGIDGASVFVATTAPAEAGDSIRRHLEREHGCRVVGTSHALSDRARLEVELEGLGEADLLLCEIKAAAVDVATRRALDEGLGVVYMDNVPAPAPGWEERGADIDAVIEWAAEEATTRYAETPSEKG